MGDKYNGSPSDANNSTHKKDYEEESPEGLRNILGTLRDRTPKWVSGVGGGLAGAVATALLLVIPVVNTWLANAKEVSLAQIKNSADQIQYITKRMEDSDHERDLYKQEMLDCQKELRSLKK